MLSLLSPRSSQDTTRVLATSSFKDISTSQINSAKKLVQKELVEWSKYNAYRFENPRGNRLGSRAKTQSQSSKIVIPNVPIITGEIAEAAALLAELESHETLNSSVIKTQYAKRQISRFWLEDMQHLGTLPYGNDKNYRTFRNVRDFGAKGDGITDDTKAINEAMQQGNRCGEKCYGSTTKNAIVYFPSGTYLISSQINSYYGTQMIGNPNRKPILKAAGSFVGLGLISTDVYTGGGIGSDGQDQEWYINTANFYRQIRNFVIDIRSATRQDAGVAGLHYQVAQATSLFNVDFVGSEDPNTQQIHLYAENGSGGFMSDITFHGGAYGIKGGNQQFTSQRITFTNVRTAVFMFWNWGWTWKSIKVINCRTGFNLTSENGVDRNTGSVVIQDSVFENVQSAIVTFLPNDNVKQNNTNIALDNIAFRNTKAAVEDKSGLRWLEGSVSNIDTWTRGSTYLDSPSKNFLIGKTFATKRPSGLVGGDSQGLPKPKFFERKRPQYENLPASQFVSVKQNGLKGDGVTDDTKAFQSVLDRFSNSNKVIFIDTGSYILTDTIKIPPGTRIVGELWPQMIASGVKFNSELTPKPLFQVGQPGQKGVVELQDLIFSSKGPTAGLIHVEWNIEASSPGAAGMWDCHVQAGGSDASQLTSRQCPESISGKADPRCKAGSLMFHLTPSGSVYLENVWLWVSDHDLDDADLNDPNNPMPKTNVFVARGLLVESNKPSWFYGTASEHSVFYQYSFQNAHNVHAGMIQTESPYYQPFPRAPAPFQSTVGNFPGDPNYADCVRQQNKAGCDSSWAVRISNSSDISFAGAGLYSFFNGYSETCIDSRTCQRSLVSLENNGAGIQFLNLITIGAKSMITTPHGEVPRPDR
ncbi:pectin lyase-like protein [Microthyrium microscopicum]|uniref:Pectin lyase-like protein n=1 Tax=Microthyrium microscopicum TaxID=703497 RepID=A0A6A6UPY2_9PEZI|nr:pectin lyase-like protein [Microthyrium microscopicum]